MWDEDGMRDEVWGWGIRIGDGFMADGRERSRSIGEGNGVLGRREDRGR